MLSFLLSQEIGACAYGVSAIEDVPEEIMHRYEAWLAEGYATGMNYLHNHLPIRRVPGLLLEGATSIISLAFSYAPAQRRDRRLSAVATYAYGDDYHDVLRSRLSGAVKRMESIFGGEYRICIDSAPIFERYWAEKCGIGERCDNGLISVAGYGTRIFLAEILSTAEIPLTKEFKPSHSEQNGDVGEIDTELGKRVIAENPVSCLHCGACQRACPAGALQSDSTVDARRCLSYLTIEHRGDWDDIGESAMSTLAGRHTLFGCDICQDVCPLNLSTLHSRKPICADAMHLAPTKNLSTFQSFIPSTGIPEFRPRPEILTITAEEITTLTPADFSSLFKGSPIKRAKLAGLLRNALNTLGN